MPDEVNREIEDDVGPRRARLLTLVALGALTLALFYRPLILGQAFYELDLRDAYLPVQVENAHQRADGILPLWNPYILYGYPISAEPESGGLYPPALLFNAPLGTERAYGLYIIGHLVLAAFAMRFLAKQLGISATGQCIAAMVFAFSGAFVAQIINLPIITTLAWAPLLLALHHRSIVRRSLRPALLAGVVLGISLLGSHPQMTLHSLMLCGLLVLMPPGEGTYRERFTWGVACLAVIVMVGLAVAAPQLVHTLAWLPEVNTGHATGTGVETPYQFLTSYSQPPHYLLQHVVPDLFGSPDTYIGASNWVEQRGYIGLVVLGLVIAGWRTAPRFCRVALVVAVLLSFGKFIGVYHALQYLPLFNMFRCPARFALVATIACAVIAGFGFDSLRDASARDRRCRIGVRVYAGAAILLTALGLLLRHAASAPDGWVGRAWSAFALLGSDLGSLGSREIEIAAPVASLSALMGAAIAAVTALWWSRARRGVTGLRARAAIIGLVAFDLWHASHGVHHFAAPDFYSSRPTSVGKDGLDRLYRVSPLNHEDVAPTSYTNLGSLRRSFLVEGFLSREPRRLEIFDLHPGTMSLAKLAAGNVRYLRSRSIVPPALEGAVVDNAGRRSDKIADITYEIAPDMRLARTYIVDRHRIIADEAELSRWINSRGFDPWHEVVLPRAPTWPTDCAEKPAIAAAASIVRYEASRVVIRAQTPRCSMLVLSDLFFPGWRATVDGSPVSVLPANGVFRAVALPPGEHTVELQFRPRGMTAALVVSALALLAALAFGGLTLLRRSDR